MITVYSQIIIKYKCFINKYFNNDIKLQKHIKNIFYV